MNKTPMRLHQNRYTFLGLFLVLFGIVFGIFALLVIEYTPLVALGTASVILGVVSLALGRSLPEVSAETSLLLLEASFDIVMALVEELGLRSRAIYLPSSLADGPLRALIPLHQNGVPKAIRSPVDQRLIVRFGGEVEDVGILVAAPGSAIFTLGIAVGGSSTDELESTLSEVIAGRLDLAKAVHVLRDGATITVVIEEPTLPLRNHAAHKVLGSTVASIAATLAAQALDRPVVVNSETVARHRHTIEMIVVEE